MRQSKERLDIQILENTVIEWDFFSIESGEKVYFDCINNTVSALNIVNGDLPSTINGTLCSNGNVALINTNGIYIGSTGVINTESFTASTNNIDIDQYFLGNEQKTLQDGILSSSPISNKGQIITNTHVQLLAESIEVGDVDAGGNVVIHASFLIPSGKRNGSFVEKKVSYGGIVVNGVVKGECIDITSEGSFARNAINITRDAEINAEGGSICLKASGGDIQLAGRVHEKDNLLVSIECESLYCSGDRLFITQDVETKRGCVVECSLSNIYGYKDFSINTSGAIRIQTPDIQKCFDGNTDSFFNKNTFSLAASNKGDFALNTPFVGDSFIINVKGDVSINTLVKAESTISVCCDGTLYIAQDNEATILTPHLLLSSKNAIEIAQDCESKALFAVDKTCFLESPRISIHGDTHFQMEGSGMLSFWGDVVSIKPRKEDSNGVTFSIGKIFGINSFSRKGEKVEFISDFHSILVTSTSKESESYFNIGNQSRKSFDQCQFTSINAPLYVFPERDAGQSSITIGPNVTSLSVESVYAPLVLASSHMPLTFRVSESIDLKAGIAISKDATLYIASDNSDLALETKCFTATGGVSKNGFKSDVTLQYGKKLVADIAHSFTLKGGEGKHSETIISSYPEIKSECYIFSKDIVISNHEMSESFTGICNMPHSHDEKSMVSISCDMMTLENNSIFQSGEIGIVSYAPRSEVAISTLKGDITALSHHSGIISIATRAALSPLSIFSSGNIKIESLEDGAVLFSTTGVESALSIGCKQDLGIKADTDHSLVHAFTNGIQSPLNIESETIASTSSGSIKLSTYAPYSGLNVASQSIEAYTSNNGDVTFMTGEVLSPILLESSRLVNHGTITYDAPFSSIGVTSSSQTYSKDSNITFQALKGIDISGSQLVTSYLDIQGNMSLQGGKVSLFHFENIEINGSKLFSIKGERVSLHARNTLEIYPDNFHADGAYDVHIKGTKVKIGSEESHQISKIAGESIIIDGELHITSSGDSSSVRILGSDTSTFSAEGDVVFSAINSGLIDISTHRILLVGERGVHLYSSGKESVITLNAAQGAMSFLSKHGTIHIESNEGGKTSLNSNLSEIRGRNITCLSHGISSTSSIRIESKECFFQSETLDFKIEGVSGTDFIISGETIDMSGKFLTIANHAKYSDMSIKGSSVLLNSYDSFVSNVEIESGGVFLWNNKNTLTINTDKIYEDSISTKLSGDSFYINAGNIVINSGTSKNHAHVSIEATSHLSLSAKESISCLASQHHEGTSDIQMFTTGDNAEVSVESKHMLFKGGDNATGVVSLFQLGENSYMSLLTGIKLSSGKSPYSDTEIFNKSGDIDISALRSHQYISIQPESNGGIARILTLEDGSIDIKTGGNVKLYPSSSENGAGCVEAIGEVSLTSFYGDIEILSDIFTTVSGENSVSVNAYNGNIVISSKAENSALASTGNIHINAQGISLGGNNCIVGDKGNLQLQAISRKGITVSDETTLKCKNINITCPTETSFFKDHSMYLQHDASLLFSSGEFNTIPVSVSYNSQDVYASFFCKVVSMVPVGLVQKEIDKLEGFFIPRKDENKEGISKKTLLKK